MARRAAQRQQARIPRVLCLCFDAATQFHSVVPRARGPALSLVCLRRGVIYQVLGCPQILVKIPRYGHISDITHDIYSQNLEYDRVSPNLAFLLLGGRQISDKQDLRQENQR